MRLDISAFGYSELRLYSSVFMIWPAFVLIWLCASEQRLTRSREELDAYWSEHGILTDSWAARRAPEALAELSLWSADGVVCTKPPAVTR